METELLWGSTILKFAPNFVWRNGNPKTDIDLFGLSIPNTKPVIVLRKDGANAPCLPLTHPGNGFSVATPPEAFGPYLKHSRLGWFYRIYVIHSGQVYSGREWIDNPKPIYSILQIQNITLPVIVDWIKKQRSQDNDIIYSDRFNNRFFSWNADQRTKMARAVA